MTSTLPELYFLKCVLFNAKAFVFKVKGALTAIFKVVCGGQRVLVQ
jgi:hypothetical protein